MVRNRTVASVTIDHDSRVPVYMQLAGIIRDQIESGVIARRVPSIRSLREEYDVSQASVVHALAVLREEGLVEAVIGKGFYVVGR